MICGTSRHYGQPAYVEQDKALIQKQIQASKNIPWEDVEALLEPGDIFTPENIESNPSYSQAATPVDDEPDSYDFLHQPSWDWRLLRGIAISPRHGLVYFPVLILLL